MGGVRYIRVSSYDLQDFEEAAFEQKTRIASRTSPERRASFSLDGMTP